MNFDSRIPVGLLAIAIGLALVVGTGFVTYALQMTIAEPVDAEVVSSNVTTDACSVDESCDVRYRPAVTYRYTYGGNTYTSDQVFPDGGHVSGRARAEDVVSEYSSGDVVTAHVVPGRPGTAYLVKTRPNVVKALFAVFGAVLVLAGANTVVRSLRGVERPDRVE